MTLDELQRIYGSQHVEMTKEIRKRGYNINKVLLGHLEGLEKECHQQLAVDFGKRYVDTGEYAPLVPIVGLRASSDSVTGGSSTGGAFVETKIPDESPIAPLYPHSGILKAGAEVLTPPRTNIDLVRFAYPVTGSSGETTTTTLATGFTTQQVSLEGIWYANTLPLSKQIPIQCADRNITDDATTLLKEGLGLLIDNLCLNGTGQTNGIGQALGLLSYSTQSVGGIDPSKVVSHTWGGAPGLTQIQNAHLGLDQANNDDGPEDRTWIISPAAKNIWATTQLATNYPEYLLSYKTGRVGAYRAITTTLLNGTNQSILLAARNAVVLIVNGAFSLTVDHWSLAASNQLRLTVGILADFGMRHACGAAISTDSAAQ